MTAVFNALRRLDARLDKGELSPAEYQSRRAAILRSVEVVDAEIESTSTDASHDSPASAPSALGLSLVVCLGVMGLSIGAVLLFLPNLNLALTLGVTLLAALSVALLRSLDD